MQASCSTLKHALRDVLILKKEGGSETDLKACLTDIALEIIRLRLCTKEQIEEVEGHKAKTAESKTEVDATSLQLQNLLYEKNYYIKEIATCRNFESRYKDVDIGLVDPETFKQQTAEVLTGTESPHVLQLKRLAHERSTRQELVKALEEVKGRKEAREAIVAEKQKHLDDIQMHLAALKEAAEPLSMQLALPPEYSLHHQQNLELASLLPMPLYIIFCQLRAVAEIAWTGTLEVLIAGSEKEAVGIAQSLGRDIFTNLEKDTASQPSKRSKKTERKSQAPETDAMAHPLSLMVQVGLPEGGSMAFQIFYIHQLEMVSVKAADPAQQQILSRLYPKDDGAELPSETAMQQAAASGVEFPTSRPDRPYVWAQHLAGLDFLPPLNMNGTLQDPADRGSVQEGLAAYRRQQRVQSTLQRICTLAQQPRQLELKDETVQHRDSHLVKPSIKRVKTWEEVQKQNQEASSSLKAMEASDLPAAKTVLDVKEDESMLPEEGELPDS